MTVRRGGWRWAIVAVAMTVGMAWTGRADAQGSAFTPAQRAEIVSILRDALKTDPTILRDAINSLQESDQEREVEQSRAAIASAGAALTRVAADPIAGNPAGDVTLVAFYDVRCPYCRRMLDVEDRLVRQDGRLRIVYKDIPVLGPASVLGARAVLAAQKQNGYLKFRTALMSGTPNLTEAVVRETAERTGLDWPRLSADMGSPEVRARIDANLALAGKLHINGTPSYVVGDRLIAGAVEYDTLEEAVGAARRR